MTLQRINYGRGHGYKIDGAKVEGVTTLIGDGLPKPALTRWAAKAVAEHVADNLDAVLGMKDMGRDAIVAALKEAPWTAARTAAAKGTEVHKLADPLSRGEQVDVPEHIAGYVEACVAFLDQWKVQPLAVECPIGNRKWKFGGTPDLFAELVTPADITPETVKWLSEPIPAGTVLRSVVDWKTGRTGVYPEAAFQEAAYRHAEVYLDGRTEKPIADLGLGDLGFAVWLRSDGFDVIPLDVSERVFRGFLHIAYVARLAKRDRDFIGEAVQL